MATPADKKRSTREVVRQRVAEVFRLRIGGAEFHDLREYADAPERNWGVSDTQLRRYIAMADALCKERFDARADHLLARHLLQRRQLYAHAVAAGDYGTATRVLQDEAKLEGLYPAEKRELTGKDGRPLIPNPNGEQTPEQKAEFIARISTMLEMYGFALVNRQGRQLLPYRGNDPAAVSDLLQSTFTHRAPTPPPRDLPHFAIDAAQADPPGSSEVVEADGSPGRIVPALEEGSNGEAHEANGFPPVDTTDLPPLF
jgi:hypothetical protein